jgi:hypothetical protein
MADQTLNEAVHLIQEGRKKDAGLLLKDLVLQDPGNADAWYWLSACVKDDEQRRACLEKALEINPNHLQARQELQNLFAGEDASPGLEGQTNKGLPGWLKNAFIIVPIVLLLCLVGSCVAFSVFGSQTASGTLPALAFLFSPTPAGAAQANLSGPTGEPATVMPLPPTWTFTPSSTYIQVRRPTSTIMPTETQFVVSTLTPNPLPSKTKAPPYNPGGGGSGSAVTSTPVPSATGPTPTKKPTRTRTATKFVPTTSVPSLTPIAPLVPSCSVAPDAVAVNVDTPLTINGAIEQSGQKLQVSFMMAEWTDGHNSFHCSAVGAFPGQVSCLGNSGLVANPGAVPIKVSLTTMDAQTLSCKTTFTVK